MKINSTVRQLLLTMQLIVTSSAAQSDETFNVCADPVNPPYSTKDQKGYENKIANLFAEQLRQKLEYTWLPDRIGFIRNTLKAENENGQGFKCDVVMGVPVGFELTDTTKAYLHSSYVLLIAKNRGWDDIKEAEQLNQLKPQRQQKLKIAMFDRGPGTEWLQQNGLLEQGVPYQSMTGDSEHNAAMQIGNELEKGNIDMAILWAPMASYIQSKTGKDNYFAIPMQSTPTIKFDYSIAMGIRQNDNKRKQLLNDLIDKNRDKIAKIIDSYHILQLPITDEVQKQDR